MSNYIFIIGAVLAILLIVIIPYLRYRADMKLLCSVSSSKRGTRSERRLVVKMLKQGVHPKAIFHDLYLQKKNGEYSQIDIVVATPQGLLAIEVKDYSGWLFGNEGQKYWTQVLNFGKEKHRFYNPLMQNEGHIKTLREQSEQFASLPIYNVVVFDGNCTLKNISYMSDNTFVGYASQIKYVLKQLNTFGLAQYTDKKEIARCLHNAVKNGDNPEIVASHLASAQRTARWQ
ncbi:MAG: nuclease-related domain-containing protein [Candidatus Cryptobacteroides sp.]